MRIGWGTILIGAIASVVAMIGIGAGVHTVSTLAGSPNAREPVMLMWLLSVAVAGFAMYLVASAKLPRSAPWQPWFVVRVVFASTALFICMPFFVYFVLIIVMIMRGHEIEAF